MNRNRTNNLYYNLGITLRNSVSQTRKENYQDSIKARRTPIGNFEERMKRIKEMGKSLTKKSKTTVEVADKATTNNQTTTQQPSVAQNEPTYNQATESIKTPKPVTQQKIPATISNDTATPDITRQARNNTQAGVYGNTSQAFARRTPIKRSVKL